MEQNNTETAPASPPVALAVLALEMETTVDTLEREVGAENVFMAGGLRSVTAFRARELAEAHHARKDEAERLMARNRERTRKFVEDRHRTIPRGFVKFELAHQTINPGGEGLLPVVAMTARDDGDFGDGTPMTKRPGVMDWIRGRGEGGAEIGPTPRQVAANAKANKRANKKGGT